MGIMLEGMMEEEESGGLLQIVDTEYQNQRTTRDYAGGNDDENARRLGKSIMDSITYIENNIKLFC